jgi:hypothetical protein
MLAWANAVPEVAVILPGPTSGGSPQAVARPSEVDERRQRTANVGRSTCRSAVVWPAASQLTIGEYQIYDI